MIATRERDLVELDGDEWAGHASLYRLDPPLPSGPYVIASAVDDPESGRQVALFAADANGRPLTFLDLCAPVMGSLDHVAVLRRAGYTLSTAEVAS